MVQHYVFFVSDREDDRHISRFRKMDSGKNIAEHIRLGMRDTAVMKYTEYDGNRIEAKSVGIIIPAHHWGSSLAVRLFLKRLKVQSGTYVYAVFLKENITGHFGASRDNVNSVDEIERIFIEQGLGTREDIYVRLDEEERNFATTEEKLDRHFTAKRNIGCIMNGLMYQNLNYYSHKTQMPQQLRMPEVLAFEAKASMSSAKKTAMSSTMAVSKKSLGNVFLDEHFLSGVRLCRAM